MLVSERQPSHFYHATLCVNAVFAVGRCPSVWLYVRLSLSRFVYCILQTAEDVVKLSSLGNSIILP